MMNEDFNEQDERFLDYYQGRLDKAESAQFEARMKQDPELKAAYDLYAESALIAESIGIADLANEVVEERAHKRRPIMRYILGIAAAAAVLLLGIFLFKPDGPNNQELFTEYFRPFPNLANSRSGTESTTLDLALKAYELADYSEAIQLFSQLDSPSDTSRIYTATSLLALGKTNEAFNTLSSIEQPLFDDAKNWYLALTLLQRDDGLKAKELLSTLLHGSAYEARARELLEELE